MDVFTFSQPENNSLVARNTKTAKLPKRMDSALIFSLNDSSYFKFLSIFFIGILCAISIVKVPEVLVHKYGLYTIATKNFAEDSLASASLRKLVLPENSVENSLIFSGDTLFTVNYTSYTVKPGDSISSIVSRVGLKNMSTLLSVNNISNARRLRAGEKIKIPSMDGIIHTVTKGDSLGKIASKYNTNINVLLDVNDLDSTDLAIGSTLFIPGAALSSLDLRKSMGELFIYPIQGRLTSPYGYRSDPFTGVRTFHTGIDLAAPTGTLIKASLDGKVATAGYSPVYGNYVIISHDGGYQTLYGHMSSIIAKRGQTVLQGGSIGRVGSTGYSTGSHLHFSVYKGGNTIDPFSVLY